MNVAKYLNRINYPESPSIDSNTLIKLHECHVFNIPFENIDVQHKTEIKLEQDHLFKKVVDNARGGFCYELNYLFYLLLIEIGFEVKMISAQIFDGEEFGPEFDHMALIINIDGKSMLADVGFGDLFTIPLQVEVTGKQFDGRNYFEIQKRSNNSFLLSMSRNGVDYEKKYLFRTDRKLIEDYSEQCSVKQHSPSSYFVKNTVVTLPVQGGRKTIFNSKYVVKINGTKTEFMIANEHEEERILEKEFNIKAFSSNV